MWSRWFTGLLIMAFAVFGAGVSLAEDGANPEARGAADYGLDAGETDRPIDSEISRVATYEDETDPLLVETPQDSFMRLAQDYLHVTEIGARSIGTVPLWPRGQLKIGPILLFPYLTGHVSWTNNVFQESDSRSSWFLTAGAGFTGQYGFMQGRGSFTFGLDYVHKEYLQRDNLAYDELVGGVGLAYKFPRGLWIKGGVKWERLVDPIGVEFKGEVKRNQWYPYIDLGWDEVFGNKFNLQVGFDVTIVEFDKEEFDTADRDEYRAHAKISYPFMKSGARVYVVYSYTWDNRPSDYQNDLHSGHQISGGIEGDIPLVQSGRLTGYAEIGYRRNLYGGSKPIKPVVDTDDSDQGSTVTFGTGLRYQVSPKTSADLRAFRDIAFSARGNYQVKTRVDASVNQNVMRDLVARLAGYFEHAKPSDGNTITRFGGGVGARYFLIDNVDLDLSLNWDNRNTAQEGYDTTQFVGSFGVTIYFR